MPLESFHENYNIPLQLANILADGSFHSINQLRNKLSISDIDLNEHIETLKIWGLDVYHSVNNGYRLLEPIQLLNKKKFYPI